MDDRPRYIAAAAGYTSSPARAIDPLEAVGEHELDELTAQAERKTLDDRIRRREATRAELERELDHLTGRCQYLRRQLKRLGQAA